MKFVCFGEPKAVPQRDYHENPDEAEYYDPPCRKGFFALPYGFSVNYLRAPDWSPDGNAECLRAPDGRLLTLRDRYAYDPDSSLDGLYRKLSEWQDALAAVCRDRSPDWIEGLSQKYAELKKLVLEIKRKESLVGRWEEVHEEKISDSAWLRQYGYPKRFVYFDEGHRPSWVMVMRDPENPPQLTADGQLDQPCEFLLDTKGARIPARRFFNRRWRPQDFDRDILRAFSDVSRTFNKESWRPCWPCDVNDEGWPEEFLELPPRPDEMNILDREACKKFFQDTLTAALEKRGVRIEQLFAWPVYPCGEETYVVALKEARLFAFNGNLWHRIAYGDQDIPDREILATYGDGWVKTSVRVYAELLKRREPKRWHRYQEELRGHEPFDALGGPQYDGDADDVENYDVFFDAEDAAACQCVAGGGSAALSGLI